jgi:CHAD domain-containing protein
MKSSELSWQEAESAALNARRVLPKLVCAYFKAGRKLDSVSSPRDMHAFRLKTKQLRYTLEAFVDLHGPGLQAKVAALRPIQNALGDANDCEVLLSEMGKRLPHAARATIAKRAGEKRKEFLRYWREEFDAPNEDKKWQQYLTRSARTHRTQGKTAP